MLKLRDLEDELVQLKLKKRNLILANKNTDEINKLIDKVENEISILKNKDI